MTPMQFFEGTRTEHDRVGEERAFAERRLADLALAVRQHEDRGRGYVGRGARPHDRVLYTRLRQICGERLRG
jgi:hypothetical protein